MTDHEYYGFCMANPNLHIERNAQGEIIIVPPTGAESDYRNTEAMGQLRQWAKADGRGKVFGPSVEVILPNGAG